MYFSCRYVFFYQQLRQCYEKKRIGLFTRNFLLQHTNLQQVEGIFNGFEIVLHNQLPLILWVTSHQLFFFI